jgi:hypothetical protein
MRSAQSYQREIRRLKDVIHDMQWVMPIYNGAHSCAGCGQMRHHGCSTDCPAAAVTGDHGEPKATELDPTP